MLVKKWFVGAVILAGVCAVQAMPIIVGSGDNSAGIYIEWKGGFGMDFVLNFAEESISGMDLIQRVADETPLTIFLEHASFGDYVNGIAYEGHGNEGFTLPADYWHYWTMEPGQDWVWSMVGASDRVVVDGTRDAWVFGRDGVPEPATLMLVGAGMVFTRRRRVR